jgi:hypothetical protein
MHTMRPILIRDVCSFITETRNLNILVINYALKLFFVFLFLQKEEMQRLWRHQVSRANVIRQVAGLKKQKFERIDQF